MELQSPLIDSRKHQQLIEQLNKMVPYYASEWTFNEQDPDVGSALALMFIHLLEGNISRLNRLPQKSLITFLNHFNVELAPATPAVAQVQFKLAEGTPNAVLIEAGLQLAANVEGSSEPVIFETEQTALLTTAKLEQIAAVYPRKDRIVQHLVDGKLELVATDEQGTGLEDVLPTFALYGSSGVNVQEHTFYIAHDYLFQIQHPSSIELSFIYPQHESALRENVQLLSDLSMVAWEYYSDGQWRAFDAVHAHHSTIRLLKLHQYALQQTELFGRESYWIRCRAFSLSAIDGGIALGKVQFERLLLKTDFAKANENSGIVPKLAFYNDLPISLQTAVEPFGDFFSPYSCFYIGSNEVFSKRGATTTISFQMEYTPYRLYPDKPKPINWKPIMRREVVDRVEQPDPVTITRVQWEYWNGRSWAILPVHDSAGAMFKIVWDGQQPCKLQFTMPEDIEQAEVNAELSYWIRARIVAVDHAFSVDAIYYSPNISDFRMTYSYDSPCLLPKHFLSYNNLELRERTSELLSGGMAFRPFQPLSGFQPAVWLGFDKPPERGPIHLYVDLANKNWTADEIPYVEWEYLRASGSNVVWTKLQVADSTNGFTQSGNIQFVGPQDFARSVELGKSGYWIRAVNRDTRHYVNNEAAYEPLVQGMYLNTIKVLQQQSIPYELPNYVDGYSVEQDVHASYYTLAYKPVLRERVWVDETEYISSHELEELKLRCPERLELLLDSDDQLMKVWVEYERVDHFLHSTSEDRHYCLDRATGKLTFGDGSNGKAISQYGADSIKVSYVSGGGSIGNVAKGAINTMQTSIAFVEQVSNIAAAAGGCNEGTLHEAIQLGMKSLAHRHRAVVGDDFEWITREAHPNIAKVKCLANYNVKLEKELGALTVVVLPKNGRRQGAQFYELKRIVEERLLKAAAASIAFPQRLQVIEPLYVEIGVRTTVWVRSMDEVVHVEREIEQKLAAFLDPIHGNNDGRGWEIGGRIHPSMFYALIKSVGPVIHIPQLLLEAYRLEHGGKVECNPDRLSELPHSIIVSGKHRVIVEVHQT